MKELAIVGCGGHGKVAAEIAEKLDWKVSFYDDSFTTELDVFKWPLIGNTDDLIREQDKYGGVFVAIGNNRIRQAVATRMQESGLVLVSLVAPDANVSRYAQIGAGVLVATNAFVGICSVVDDGAIINSAAIVDHDCTLGAFCHVSPGAILAGAVTLGEQVWVGMGSTIKEAVNIGSQSIVGAGSVVLSNLPPSITAYGCPAKIAN